MINILHLQLFLLFGAFSIIDSSKWESLNWLVDSVDLLRTKLRSFFRIKMLAQPQFHGFLEVFSNTFLNLSQDRQQRGLVPEHESYQVLLHHQATLPTRTDRSRPADPR